MANRAWESSCDIAFRSENSGNEFAVDEIREVVMQRLELWSYMRISKSGLMKFMYFMAICAK